jgi:Protein phosphatase 2C
MIFIVAIILILGLGLIFSSALFPILIPLSLPLLLIVIALLFVVVLVLIITLTVSALRGEGAPDTPRASPRSAAAHGRQKRSKGPKGPKGRAAMASGANEDDTDTDTDADGGRRQNLDDDETQPSPQSTGPMPALKTSKHAAPPPPPQPLLQTRAVDEDEDEDVAWTKNYTWVDPDPYTDQERANHPHERGDWQPFGEKWVIAAASARGLEHRNGKYRDDDYAIRVLSLPGKSKGFFRQSPGAPYAAIIAIADGLGSRKLSRHGARAAAQGAVAVDERLVRTIYECLQTSHHEHELWQLGREALNAAFEAAAEGVTQQTKVDRVTAEELHSTLILVLAIIDPQDPNRLTLFASQVGDGGVYTVERVPAPAGPTAVPIAAEPDSPDAADNTGSGSPATPSPWRWFLKPQVEPTGTQVTPFMVRYNADPERLLTEMQGLNRIPLLSLLAMTDGPAEVLTPYAPTGDADVFQHVRPFFADVAAILRDTNDEKAIEAKGTVFEKKAKELLQRKLRVGDDVTLVCLFHKGLVSGK